MEGPPGMAPRDECAPSGHEGLLSFLVSHSWHPLEMRLELRQRLGLRQGPQDTALSWRGL